jgi:phosphoribosylformylglycinamidine synthase
VKYANKILAATTDCNSLYCALDPRAGGKIAVAEAARNLTCSGAEPIAVTDNLNFGNPYKPENFWQLREAVEGLAEACRAFGTPVVGGNVSLYNESPAGVVDPTPTVGMVGLIDQAAHITTQWFKQAGDAVILVAPKADPNDLSLGASRFLKVCHGRKEGPVPAIDLAAEIAVQNAVRQLIRSGMIKSAHDCSEGGIAVALAECCFNPEGLLGANVNCSARRAGGAGDTPATTTEVLFNEAQSRILVSVAPDDAERAMHMLTAEGIAAIRIGTVSETELSIKVGPETLRWPVAQLHDEWWNSIRRAVEGDASTDRVPSL